MLRSCGLLFLSWIIASVSSTSSHAMIITSTIPRTSVYFNWEDLRDLKLQFNYQTIFVNCLPTQKRALSGTVYNSEIPFKAYINHINQTIFGYYGSWLYSTYFVVSPEDAKTLWEKCGNLIKLNNTMEIRASYNQNDYGYPVKVAYKPTGATQYTFARLEEPHADHHADKNEVLIGKSDTQMLIPYSLEYY